MLKVIPLFALIFVSVSFSAISQSTVRGKVTSRTDGTPLPGVSILVKGTNTGTTTDFNGAYSINASPTSTLVFSFIGFTTQEIPVESRSVVDVVLEEDVAMLSEVVVTALGIEREKKSLGYAIQEVKGSQLVEARETNLANAFTGKVAGLQVVRSSNGAGGSSKIVLRGHTSLTGSNQPLIVVDGIPIDNFTGTTENGYWGAGLDMGSGLGDISAEDIESMSVLKVLQQQRFTAPARAMV